MVNINASILNNKSDELKIIHTYRYFSWFLTSLFYFFGDPPSHWMFKCGVIILIYISARIIIEIYNKFENNKFDKLLVFMETLGITFLLIPTGGLNSPFIWYALNPVLISTSFISYYFCWLNLICYLSVTTIFSYIYFNPNNDEVGMIISRNSHLILIFTLITLAVQLLMKLTDKIRKQSRELMFTNSELTQANIRIQESMNYIMSLYQIIGTFTAQDNKKNLYQTIAEYTRKLTNSDYAFLWLPSESEEGGIYVNGVMSQEIQEVLIKKLEFIWNEDVYFYEQLKLNMDNEFIIVKVKSSADDYGLIGIRANKILTDNNKLEYVVQLNYISQISGIILEKYYLDEVTERLIIAEEQNRIANEIHDSVVQRLFSISCGIHATLINWNKMTVSQINEQLSTIQNSTHAAIKELRSTIYRLSSRKGGGNTFKSDINNYIDTISKLNNIHVQLEIKGDDEVLSVSKKRGLYRIICEATSNALRHGKCSLLKIYLDIDKVLTRLKISDNGDGFIISNLDKKDTGLGITNMKRLVGLFDGEFNIISNPGNGTDIEILIPASKEVVKNKEGVAI